MTPSSFRPLRFILGLALLVGAALAACNLPAAAPRPTATPTPTPLPQAKVTFTVTAPQAAGAVELVLLDEVTGLNLNPEIHPMQAVGKGRYQVSVEVPVAAVLKYRYHRRDGQRVAAEALLDGALVRYRLLRVDGAMAVHDTIGRWNDTFYQGGTGRIAGKITDPTGQPVPDILVAVAGAQTLTHADGTFLLENLPTGVHNLVAYALDGRYRPFQHLAEIADQATTLAPITLTPRPLVAVTFDVAAPADEAPAGAAVRLAGNLLPLGNTFSDLGGSLSVLATRCPTLARQPDGHYRLTLQLPAGAYLRYKYTLGDGFWNAEHDPAGHFVVRTLRVPDHAITVHDTVATWRAGQAAAVWFEVETPANTPPADLVDLQLNPALWTPPLPMWPLGQGRWGYLLLSPTDLTQGVRFRFCRAEQCAAGSQAENADKGFLLAPAAQNHGPRVVKQAVTWRWWQGGTTGAPATPPRIAPRDGAAWGGVALMPAYRPSWPPYTGRTMAEIRKMSANVVVLTPTWTASLANPPLWAPRLGQDPLTSETIAAARQAQGQGLQVMLFPTLRFPQGRAGWWAAARHDFPWWVTWYERYRDFARHAATLAAASQAKALILGGAWVQPAILGNPLPDGQAAGTPADASQRWREIIAAAREIYPGPIYWALPETALDRPPDFLDAVDGLYILWAPDLGPNPQQWPQRTAQILDQSLEPLQQRLHKPVLLAVRYPAAQGARGGCLPGGKGCLPPEALFPTQPAALARAVDLGNQSTAYAALLQAVGQRRWINGLISADFYPPTSMEDPSASVHGKPVSGLLTQWFETLQQAPAAQP